jgi:hypothetical protein
MIYAHILSQAGFKVCQVPEKTTDKEIEKLMAIVFGEDNGNGKAGKSDED